MLRRKITLSIMLICVTTLIIYAEYYNISNKIIRNIVVSITITGLAITMFALIWCPSNYRNHDDISRHYQVDPDII
jgi:hypothetical protein